MADTLEEQAIVLALKTMTLLKAGDAPKVELLSDQDQCQTYKVCADGPSLLVRSLNKSRCAAAHFYATTAACHVPDLRPRVPGHDAERGIMVEEWLDPGEYKSLGQELLQESASIGWSTPFRADKFSEVDFEGVLQGVGENSDALKQSQEHLAELSSRSRQVPSLDPMVGRDNGDWESAIRAGAEPVRYVAKEASIDALTI